MKLMLDSPEVTMTQHQFKSPRGWCTLSWYDDSVRGLRFAAASPAPIDPPLWGIPRIAGKLTLCQRDVVDRVRGMLAGRRVDFADVAIHLENRSEFDRLVTEECRRIGWGKTRSYAELAKDVGHPGAARAVGNVMRRNPIPLIVPCHRVVGAAGRLGGYSAPGGLATKRWLLDLEN